MIKYQKSACVLFLCLTEKTTLNFEEKELCVVVVVVDLVATVVVFLLSKRTLIWPEQRSVGTSRLCACLS